MRVDLNAKIGLNCIRNDWESKTLYTFFGADRYQYRRSLDKLLKINIRARLDIVNANEALQIIDRR